MLMSLNTGLVVLVGLAGVLATSNNSRQKTFFGYFFKTAECFFLYFVF
jgi:hypothetical protein